MKKIILDSYNGKILGIRNYRSDKREFRTSDFINLETLEDFLEEVDTGESDITPAGKAFFKDYYGFDNLAAMLLERGEFTKSRPTQFISKEGIRSWLEQVVPMETIRFIEEARGNLGKGQQVRADLLPPADIL